MTPEQLQDLLRVVQTLQAENAKHAQILRETVAVLEGLYNAAAKADTLETNLRMTVKEDTQETG